jgi:hypothetical protein
MEEMILYQGKPMVTIKGRRRKDAEAGHRPDIRFRFLNSEEKDGFTEAGALHPGDLVQICVLTTEWGNTVEAVGTVSKAQRDSHRQPVVNTNPLEMVQKRAEDRARSMAYGPLPRPQLPAGLDVIEGEGRLIEEEALPSSQAERLAPPTPAPAPTSPQLATAPQGQRRPRPAGFCQGHGADMFKSRATQKVAHVLPGGAVCEGIAAAPTSPSQGEGRAEQGQGQPVDEAAGLDDGAPRQEESAELPPSHQDDVDALRTEVDVAGLTWADFCRDILGMPWGEWEKLRGTVAGAQVRLKAYVAKQGGG